MAGAQPSIAGEGAGPLVLQVLPALQTGGVERGTVEIASGLIAAGWRSAVASAGGPMERELIRIGAAHHELPLASKSPFRMQRNADALAELIRREGIDLVHARSRAPAWSALSATRRAGVPFITTYHSPYGESGGQLKQAYNAVMGKGDQVIAISRYIGDLVRQRHGLDDDRLSVIHRGVNTEIFDPAAVSAERQIQLARAWRLPEAAPVIMLPGRLTRWKGQTLLIEALARLGRDDVAVVLVGSDQGRGAYRRELEALAARHGLDAIVRVVEHCRDMPAAYMLADVVVSASLEPEGFGRIVAEAQAMGRPVVAPDHGAAPEIVLPGETGRLFAPRDAEALAEALADALSLDGETRSAIAERARENVLANFTLERMCQRTIEVYRRALKLS